MSTSHIYHTQGIRNYHRVKEEYVKDAVLIHIEHHSNKYSCRQCHSKNVSIIKDGERKIQGLKSGLKQVYFIVPMHRIKCHDCNSYNLERLDFISRPKVHYTRAMERTVIELRKEMTISALAKYFNLNWHTVKEIEKRHLEKKYKHIRLKEVEYIGIDEVYVGKSNFLTIVRDMKSGSVLFVGEGKGGDALSGFVTKLKHSKCNIIAVAVDLAPSYSSWVKKNLPNADIVYDHFHLIKLMNEKINVIRRKTMNSLDEELKKELKGTRWILVRNIECLNKKEKGILDNLRDMFEDLGTASFLKEALRRIYAIAQYAEEAETGLNYWCKLAIESEIKQMETMAKTIQRNMEGIKGYWTHFKLTSASMEGFNNKIGWLNRQAYGYRDKEYFRLKIFDLPKTSIDKEL